MKTEPGKPKPYDLARILDEIEQSVVQRIEDRIANGATPVVTLRLRSKWVGFADTVRRELEERISVEAYIQEGSKDHYGLQWTLKVARREP